MKYTNPIIRGVYPDPSVCTDGKKFYLVCSSFHFFPGVPLFESEDMLNWKQIGHCLTRNSQLPLPNASSSTGIYAPTIRYDQGRFYMVTTNTTFERNFYVYTDDIYGEWSEPILVEQDGIDPSLYFEDGHAYFMSNGNDEDGRPCVQQCEIDIKTGKKLTESRPVWYGTGGRYLEAPHLYKIGDWYYILNAEGGTEYGHMVNYARGKSLWGPFESYAHNPVLTNRNLGGYQLQGAGHGDLIKDLHGNWWFVHLAFRQIHRWLPFHHLGREVCLQPVQFENDWFTIGINGTALLEIEIPDNDLCSQQGDNYCLKDKEHSFHRTFETLTTNDWVFLRNPNMDNYEFKNNSLKLTATPTTVSNLLSPTFAGIRQSELAMDIHCCLSINSNEAGLTLYMDENHHYEIFVTKQDNNAVITLRLTIGCISKEMNSFVIKDSNPYVHLHIKATPLTYEFNVIDKEKETNLGIADTRYLSSEVACGFTGVIIGLYAVGHECTEFTELSLIHNEDSIS